MANKLSVLRSYSSIGLAVRSKEIIVCHTRLDLDYLHLISVVRWGWVQLENRVTHDKLICKRQSVQIGRKVKTVVMQIRAEKTYTTFSSLQWLCDDEGINVSARISDIGFATG